MLMTHRRPSLALIRYPLIRAAGAAVLLGSLTGCLAPWQRLDAQAARGGFSKRVVAGAGFEHVLYERPGTTDLSQPLIVVLEGDGRPWVHGRQVADDPTPHEALGLALALATPGAVRYLVRPCYHEFVHAPGCSPALWSSARYSAPVVASLVTAIGALDPTGQHPIWLVGYSGGGALAALVGARLPRLTRLVTVAANLDTAAWTAGHGYLALNDSLNPATEPPLPASVRQIHWYGEADTNVPAAAVRAYAARQPDAVALGVTDFDHRCCWAERWPALWASVVLAPAAASGAR